MTALADRLRPLLYARNVTAFLHVLREGESRQDDAAYFIRWGGIGKPPAYFTDLSRHPRIFEPGPNGPSSAAGAYQITATTYDDFAPRVGVTDFSRESQDLLALAIIDREHAMPDILAGDPVAAIRKLGGRWASLPSSEVGQPTVKLERLLDVYRRYGGIFSSQATEAAPSAPAAPDGPSPPRPRTAPPAAEPPPVFPRGEGDDPFPAFPFPASEPMGPLTIGLSLLPELLSMAPAVIRLFGKSDSAERNAKALEIIGPKLAPTVYDAARKALDRPEANEQAVVEGLRADKDAQKRFNAELAMRWDELAPMLDKAMEIAIRGQQADDESRDKAAARSISDPAMSAATPLLIRGALGGAAFVFVSLFVLLILQTIYSPDHRPMGELVALFITTCGTIIGFALTIYLYRFGSSSGSKASGDAVRAIAESRR